MSRAESSTSFQAILQSAKNTLKRFPLVLLSAALGTGIGISWLFHSHDAASDDFFISTGRILLIALLGIPWLYSLTVFAERRPQGPSKMWLPLIGVAALVLYYFRLHGINEANAPLSVVFEIAAIWFGLHFLAAYAPFIGVEEPRGFWEYNRTIFLRFLLALLFSLTLWIGIGIFFALLQAIIGMDFILLSGVAGLLILGIFNTWFFLAGVPEDWRSLEYDPRPYPRALKFFAQFILVPLVILIGISLEILFIQELSAAEPPQSSVAGGFLVLGGIGLLTFLLLFPLSADPQRRWLRIYRRGLAIAMLPPLLWLAYASVGKVQSEGWTPPYYYLLLLSAWGIGMAAYLATVQRPKIQWIPMSLSLIAAISAIPFVGATSFSRRSQQNQLAALFDQHGLQQGSPDLNKIAALPDDARRPISEKTRLLSENFGCEALRPFFGDSVDPENTSGAACRSLRLQGALDPDSVTATLDPSGTPTFRLNFNQQSRSYEGVAVEGFSLFFPEGSIDQQVPKKEEAPCREDRGEPSLCVVFDEAAQTLEFFLNRQAAGRVDLKPTLEGLVSQYAKDLEKPAEKPGENPDHYYDLSERQMSFDYPLKGRKLRLRFSHIYVKKTGPRINATGLSFSALLH